MSALQEVTEAVQKAAADIGPSVVAIERYGSGLAVDDRLVVTNAHNIRGGEVEVLTSEGRRIQGAVKGVDVDSDLAVVEAETGAPPIRWCEEKASLGEVVIALANPRGRGLRATVGTVSSLGRAFRGPRGRRIAGGIEHTAPLGRGSSGGPLVNVSGSVIGLNTHRLQEGFYLAVATDRELVDRIARLSRGEEPTRYRLGAAVAPPQAARHLRQAVGLPEVDGLLVRRVEPEGPADRAGIRRGDVLVTAGGRPLHAIDDLYEALGTEARSLELRLVRATEELAVTVEFSL